MSTDSNATSPTGTGAAIGGALDGDLSEGMQVGEYVVDHVLGRGGFGTVYRATHPLIGKRVAIKVLSRRYSADADMVSRFVAEARAVNQIQHRHIIDIFSFGQLDDGRQYFVMEFLEGQPLDAYLNARGALPLAEALPILKAIARALGAAHAKGIAHRDLKPENIYLVRDEDGQFPKLLDFGIAKLSGPDDQMAHKTGTGVPLGTPYYMSPEQCRGRDVDTRTDIYSFGVLTYRVLTGTYPFEGDLIDILHKQMHEPAEPPSVRNPALTGDVDAAIAWMMQKSAIDRPASVLDGVSALAPGVLVNAVTPAQLPPVTGVGHAIHGHAATLAAGAPRVAADAVIAVPRRRNQSPMIFGALAIVGAAAVTTVLVLGRSHEPRSPPTPPTSPTPSNRSAPAVAVVPPDAPPPAPDATPSPAPLPIAAEREVTFSGTPAGAVVFLGAKRVGRTDLPVRIPVVDAPLAIRLEAPGYRSADMSVGPDATRFEYKLTKRSRPAKPGGGENDILPFPE